MQRFPLSAARWAWILAVPVLACGGNETAKDEGGCPDGGCLDGITFDPGPGDGTMKDDGIEEAREVQGELPAEIPGEGVDDAEPDPGDAVDTEGEVVYQGVFGDPCNSNDDCQSYLCIPTLSGRFCTVTCIENCPGDWKCEYISPPGMEPLTACVPPEIGRASCRERV